MCLFLTGLSEMHHQRNLTVLCNNGRIDSHRQTVSAVAKKLFLTIISD